MIKLKINNRPVEVPEGTTILQAARKLGIFIPTFCYDDNERLPERRQDGCEEHTKCWMCSCQVEGQDYMVPACSTKAENGMVVWTETETVREARIAILRDKLAIHPMDCVNCRKLGTCRLQKYCQMYGVNGPSYTASIYGYDREELTHTSVAAQIASSSADAGMGIYSAAKLYDLDFIPICIEEYDLIIPDHAWDTPMVGQLLSILKSDAFREKLLRLGGYTLENPGEVIPI